MKNPAFAATEVDEGVVLGDSEVTERSGYDVPRRRRIPRAPFDRVLGQHDRVRSVESAIEHTVCEAVQSAHAGSDTRQGAREPIGSDQSLRDPGTESNRRQCVAALCSAPFVERLPASSGILGGSIHCPTG